MGLSCYFYWIQKPRGSACKQEYDHHHDAANHDTNPEVHTHSQKKRSYILKNEARLCSRSKLYFSLIHSLLNCSCKLDFLLSFKEERHVHFPPLASSAFSSSFSASSSSSMKIKRWISNERNDSHDSSNRN